MLLRGSGQTHGSAVNLSSVVDGQTESGVPHGAVLIAFSDAVLGNDEAALESARSHVLQDLGPQALIDAAAIVATFQQMDRIADGTGIPLDEFVVEPTQDLRAEIGLNDFSSARSTLGR